MALDGSGTQMRKSQLEKKEQQQGRTIGTFESAIPDEEDRSWPIFCKINGEENATSIYLCHGSGSARFAVLYCG
jgi:hypothetical protein